MNIKDLRQKQGLTQKDVANKLGMTLNGYANWERGISSQKHIERVAALCSMLNCDPTDLL